MIFAQTSIRLRLLAIQIQSLPAYQVTMSMKLEQAAFLAQLLTPHGPLAKEFKQLSKLLLALLLIIYPMEPAIHAAKSTKAG